MHPSQSPSRQCGPEEKKSKSPAEDRQHQGNCVLRQQCPCMTQGDLHQSVPLTLHPTRLLSAELYHGACGSCGRTTEKHSSLAATDLQTAAAATVLPHTANKARRAPEHGAPSPPGTHRFHSCHTHTQPSPRYLLNESQERFPVVLPLLWKLRSRWVFAAGQLQCDLKAVGPHVVVILHPT